MNISAMYKEKADLRAFLEIVLSITIVIVFLLFAIKPTALTIISLVQEINKEKETLVTLTQKVNDLQTAGNLLTQNQNFINDIDTAVSSAPAPDAFSEQIEGLSTKDSVQVLGIAIDQVVLVGSTPTLNNTNGLTPLPGGALEMPFSLSISGDYASLINFIKDFENLRMVSKIDTLGITSSLTDKGRVIVAVISGRVPFLGNN
jgi:hypothetical protein